MAKLKYTLKDVANGDSYTGVEIVFNNRTFISKFWVGDSRTLLQKIDAHKLRLWRDAVDEALTNGLTPPDPG